MIARIDARVYDDVADIWDMEVLDNYGLKASVEAYTRASFFVKNLNANVNAHQMDNDWRFVPDWEYFAYGYNLEAQRSYVAFQKLVFVEEGVSVGEWEVCECCCCSSDGRNRW